MNIKTKIAALLLGATLAVSCTKSLDMNEQGNSELDWSRTSTITLNEVAMASSTRATDNLMEVNQTFRLYAIDPATKNIIATRTYTIKDVAGKPVVDDPQNAVIELPFGTVDIFLVGPVKVTLDAVETEIAGPDKVTPVRGVDLISSLKRITITKKNTTIEPTPLRHRMVKLELVVNMVQDVAGGDLATYQDAKMTDPKHFIGIDNMGGTGTFTFDDQGGSVTSTPGIGYQYTYTAGNTGTGKIVQTNPGEEIGGTGNGFTGAVYTVTDYVPPTSATTPKLSVTYGYTRRDVGTKTEIVAHEMSGKTTAPQPWEGGTYVKISTTLIPSINMTLRTEIKPWFDGGTTPVEPPVNNDLLFWYSGEDAPEVIDGKMCWRDRSGNGNHAVITGDMVYDAVNKCYYATTGNGSFIVPALGQVAEYTLELTAQSVYGASNLAVNFNGADGAAGIGMNLPYTNIVVWYCPDQIQYQYTNDKYIWEQLNSYAFCRNATTAAIVINGAEKKSVAMSTPWASFDKNSIWGATRNVTPEKQRLYGAKMYKKYMNDATGRNTLASNHAAKLSQLGVNAPLSGTTFDYVKDGLIVDLRGTDALVSNQWQDRSGKGNHAQVFGSIARNATSDGYVFPGNSYANYMKFVKSLGNVPHITVEIVTKSHDENRDYQQILVSAAQDPVLFPGVNVFEIWWAYAGKQALIDAPFSNSSPNRLWLPGSEMVNPTTTLSQLSLAKYTTNQITLRQNGYTYTDKIITNNMAIPELKNVYLGAKSYMDNITAVYKGEIYAVRIYNRALSDMERQHNYLVDQAKYKILP